MNTHTKHRLLTGLCLTVFSMAAASPSFAGRDDQRWNGSHYGNQQYGKQSQQYESTRHTDYAKVTHAEPIYKNISQQVPTQHCQIVSRYEPIDRGQSHTPLVLGTLIGGALGNELGHKKKNKQVGAVLGGVLGATLANDWNKSRHSNNGSRVVNEEVCETQYHTEYEQRIVGYNVKYRYQGRYYTTRMNQQPGKQIQVAVQVSPL